MGIFYSSFSISCIFAKAQGMFLKFTATLNNYFSFCIKNKRSEHIKHQVLNIIKLCICDVKSDEIFLIFVVSNVGLQKSVWRILIFLIILRIRSVRPFSIPNFSTCWHVIVN